MHVLQSNIDHGNRGGRPHRSFDDPSDPLEVIRARLFNKNGSRIDSMHIHKDGSTKLESEQSGKTWVEPPGVFRKQDRLESRMNLKMLTRHI
jgi:hypothetical protein